MGTRESKYQSRGFGPSPEREYSLSGRLQCRPGHRTIGNDRQGPGTGDLGKLTGRQGRYHPEDNGTSF